MGIEGTGPRKGTGRLPVPLREFLELFNRREYWDSHEALEDAWRRTGSEFYHGLILYASAFVHARRGNAHGVVAQLEKAERALGPYTPAHLGIDVDAILEHGVRCRALVGEARGSSGDWEEQIRYPRIDPDPARIRGTEPELEDASG